MNDNYDDIPFNEGFKELMKIGSREDDTLELAKKIAKEFPDTVFGGSFALKQQDIIERYTRDLDILFHQKDYSELAKTSLMKWLKEQNAEVVIDEGSDLCENPDVSEINKVLLNGVTIDLILLDSNTKLNVKPGTLDNVQVKWQVTKDIIEAKQFLIRNNKHQLDLDYILSQIP